MSLIGHCDALYVSARAGEAELACAARMRSERERGLRVLVVTLFDPGSERDGELFLGLPRANERDPNHDPWAQRSGGIDEEAWIADTAAILDDVFMRAGPRHLYIPLGLGGFAERRVAHEASLRTFQAEAGRDVFLYEERPEVFVSGSVRIRLAQLGARLPPAASKVAGEGGLGRLLLRSQTVLHAVAPSSLDDVRAMVRASAERAGVPAVADRMIAFSSDYARRLGVTAYVERYWLVLPRREDEIRSVVTGAEVSALS
jgi:hypothetical protein